MIELSKRGNVFVLCMNAGENRFNGELVSALHEALDKVESHSGPAALVTTGTGKLYSNGLDLAWIAAQNNMPAFLAQVHRLFARMLAFPAVTVAALNGHAYAAGAMLGLAHDVRVMREDRGFFCLPEVDLGLPFTPAMRALISARLPQPTLHEAMVTGKRYPAREALARGIVDEVVPEAEVLPRAIALAEQLSTKNRNVLAQIKRDLYEPALRVMSPAQA